MTSKTNLDLIREVVQRFVLRGDPIVGAMYDGYRRHVMPANASPVQVLECKRAYFAGARTLFDLLMIATDEGDEVIGNDEKILTAIDDELKSWMDDGQMQEHDKVVRGLH